MVMHKLQEGHLSAKLEEFDECESESEMKEEILTLTFEQMYVGLANTCSND